MTALYLKPTHVLMVLVMILVLALTGCKKESPSPEQPDASQTTTQDKADANDDAATTGQMSTPLTTSEEQTEAEKEREFLSDPDVVTCELEEIATSLVDIPEDGLQPSFMRRVHRQEMDKVMKGTITLVGRPFTILLGEDLEREFYLFDIQKGFGPYWLGSWRLHSYHKIDGEFCQFMLVEDGAKIAAKPYKGDIGTIRIGKGNRNLDRAEFNGSVYQAGFVSAPIGTIEPNWPAYVEECEIPVGDYTAHMINVRYGSITFSISNNYYTNAQGQSRNDKERVYGVHIRKDTPYVLDFSNKPMVIFERPSASQRSFRRGEKITFGAVLIDPKLDIMIRSLGNAFSRKNIDPKVVITRASGKIVAEGVMPFG